MDANATASAPKSPNSPAAMRCRQSDVAMCSGMVSTVNSGTLRSSRAASARSTPDSDCDSRAAPPPLRTIRVARPLYSCATVRRARPVVLTALAAILAMIPLSRSAFWGPMAITIMGGLFVATFLTLLYLPGLYALWFRKSLEQSGGSEHIDLAPQHQGESKPAFPLAEAAE